MTTVLRAGSATDVGRVRNVNQDSKLISDRVFAVADGMGGHQGGEVASAMTVEILGSASIEPTVESLLAAAHTANRAVFDRASESADLRGMGTTLCAITLVEPTDGGDDDEIGMVNVGDSRIYLYRDGELLQLTTDHSLVEDLKRDGQLSAEEAAVHPQRNILTRALGIDPDVVIDSRTVIPYTGDRYLICSDGLFNEVDEDQIADTLRQVAEPDAAAEQLVRMANDHGGRDNVTCVIVDVVDDGGRSRAASEALAAEAGDDPTAVQASLETQPGPTAPPAPTAGVDDPLWDRAVRHDTEDHLTGDLARGRLKHITWRVVLFFFVILLIAAAAIGTVGYLNRHTYYVGYGKDGRVTIFKGTPSGDLWFKATVEQKTSITRDQVPAEYRDAVKAGKEQSSRGKAVDYVQAIKARIDKIQQETGSTTTSTTSTTTEFSVGEVPPTPVAPTTVLPSPPP